MTPDAPALETAGRRAHSRLAWLVGQPLFWVIFVAIGLLAPIVRSIRIALPRPLPILSTVPAFEFTDESGGAFGSSELEGTVWVANAIFTRCPTVCPLSTQRMFQLQHHGRGLGQYFHLVSFSVDPEYDTPERLRAYARQHRVSPRMWTFLTGDRDKLKTLLNDGLKIYMGKQDDVPPDDLMSIGHGSHFVLIDSHLRIRGYYDLSVKEQEDLLLRDAGLLASRGE